MDRAFDVLNSKSKYGSWNKRAITPSRLEEVKEIYEEFRNYLLSLYEPGHHSPLYVSRRKTFIVGFICTFYAVIQLAGDLFQEGFTYLPTFRISQDFIETLFSKIRRMGGFNNNPTSLAFRSALRKLLAKQSISASKVANTLDCDSSEGVFTLTWSKRRAPVPNNESSIVDIPDELISQLQSLRGTSLLRDNIIQYVSGYLVRRLEGCVKCENCAQAIVCPRDNSHSDHCYMASFNNVCRLQMVKDRGGLITATDPVFHIIKRCEQIICTYLTPEFIAKPKSSQILLALFMRSVLEDRPVVFLVTLVLLRKDFWTIIANSVDSLLLCI